MPQDYKIRQLMKLVSMIDKGLLGADWETRQQLKIIREKAVKEIKARQQEMQNRSVIK
jgi:hypothetical protein